MCDTFVMLTADGPVFGKNSDRDAVEPQALRWYPPADHAPGSQVRTTWTSIPQVGSTRGVLLSQPWWMWGAEMGANDAGVVAGNEAVFTRRTGEPRRRAPSLLGMDLLRLALERAGSAQDAVGVVVDLLERHGQGGPCSHEHPRFTYDNSFLFADREGAIVLETAGRRWATREVRGPGAAISNALTIPEFARPHADPLKGRVASAARRRGCTLDAVRRAARPGSGDPVRAAVAALRGHGGSPSPTYSVINGALGGPCAHAGGLVTSTQTTGSWVSDLRGGVARHLATGTSAPCLSVFRPLRLGDQFGEPPHGQVSNRYDPASRWWRHEEFHRLAVRDHASATARFAGDRDRIEAALLQDADGADTVEADRLVDEAVARWTAELRAANLPDRRPAHVRTLWTRWDSATGVPR